MSFKRDLRVQYGMIRLQKGDKLDEVQEKLRKLKRVTTERMLEIVKQERQSLEQKGR